MGSKLGSLHPAETKGSILREGVFDREDKEAALISYAKMELSRVMVWTAVMWMDVGQPLAPHQLAQDTIPSCPCSSQGHCQQLSPLP